MSVRRAIRSVSTPGWTTGHIAGLGPAAVGLWPTPALRRRALPGLLPKPKAGAARASIRFRPPTPGHEALCGPTHSQGRGRGGFAGV